MYGTFNPGINPYQSRMDNLMQQKQLIEQQMQSLQQLSNIPPININNNMLPTSQQPTQSFDFNGKWVDNEEQARGIVNNNLPVVAFDNNSPIFYMKNPDGVMKKFRFEEIVETSPDNQVNERMNQLENKLDMLINALSGQTTQADINNQTEQKQAENKPKTANRGGTKQ